MEYQHIKNICYSEIKSTSNTSINNILALHLGANATAFLSQLVNKEYNHQTDNEGWFYYQQHKIEENCCFLTKYIQTKSIKILIEKNILKVKKIGVPSKNYYFINYVYIYKLLQNQQLKKLTPSGLESKPLNNINNNIKPFSSKEENIDKSIFPLKEKGFSSETSFRDNHPILPVVPSGEVRKLNRKNNLPIKPSIPVKQKPSIKDEINAGIRQTTKARINALPTKPKKTPYQNVPEKILATMALWGELGFKLPDPAKAPKGYNKTIDYLKKIQTGKLIPGEERKFTLDDVQEAIIKFSLIALDPEYGPANLEIKKALANKSLVGFLYCPDWSKNQSRNKVISWMVKCQDDPPLEKNKSVGVVEDKNPEVTKKLKAFYCRHVMCGFKRKEWSPSEENKFREASNKIGEAYSGLSNRLLGVSGKMELAEILCKSIVKCYGENITRIFPGSLGSSFAMSRMLAYLKELGMIEENNYE